MFCPYCGATEDDKTAFCSNCGANISNVGASAESGAQNTPVGVIPPVQPITTPIAHEPKMRKGKYIRKAASKKVKVLAYVVWAVFLGIVLVLGLGVNSVVTNSVTEIPAVKMVLPENQTTNLLEDVEGIDEMLEEADTVLEDAKDDLTAEEYEVIKDALKDVKNFTENQSLSNTKAVVNSLVKATEIAEKYPEHEKLAEHFEAAEFAKEIEEPMALLDVAIYIMIGFAAFIALLTLLAVVLKNNFFSILALLLCVVPYYLLTGAVYTAILAALFIVLVVMFIIINKEYKSYKRGH